MNHTEYTTPASIEASHVEHRKLVVSFSKEQHNAFKINITELLSDYFMLSIKKCNILHCTLLLIHP